MKKPGFTLLELLISITIFSGLLILALATFAQSAATSYRSDVQRQKVEAARSVVSQITNDNHYVYLDKNVQFCVNNSPQCTSYKGFGINLDPSALNSLTLALRYNDQTYARKTYLVKDNTLKVIEERNCTPSDIDPTTIKLTCTSNSNEQPILGPYLVETSQIATQPVFSGSVSTPTYVGYYKLTLEVKPNDVTTTCQEAPTNPCYTTIATLVPRSY